PRRPFPSCRSAIGSSRAARSRPRWGCSEPPPAREAAGFRRPQTRPTRWGRHTWAATSPFFSGLRAPTPRSAIYPEEVIDGAVYGYVSVYVILDWRGVRSVESHRVERVSGHDPLAHWESPRPSKIYKATNKKATN